MGMTNEHGHESRLVADAWTTRGAMVILPTTVLIAAAYVAISLVEFYLVWSGQVAQGDPILFSAVAAPLEISGSRALWGLTVILLAMVVRGLIASRGIRPVDENDGNRLPRKHLV
jgi:hypothetical protein